MSDARLAATLVARRAALDALAASLLEKAVVARAMLDSLPRSEPGATARPASTLAKAA